MNISYDSFPLTTGRLIIRGKGKLSLGKHVMINSNRTANPVGLGYNTMIYVSKNAQIKLNDKVGLTNNLLYAIEYIEIGDYTLIGGGTQIFDSDFHSLNPFIRNSGTDSKRITKPVIIESRCFIGANCIILKGVRIGSNSVVAAGSIVSKSIPPNEIWGGNPARFIKKLKY